MSTPLEFAFPVSPTNLGVLNKNIRKWRILQYDTGDGMLPMLVGTYAVDVTTGEPIQIQNFQSPLPNFTNQLIGSATGATILPVASSGFHQFTIYKLTVSTSAASRVNIGGSSTGNYFYFDILNAAQSIDINFLPYGLASSMIGGGINPFTQDLIIKSTGGATITAFILANVQ